MEGELGWVILGGCDCPCHAANEKRQHWAGTCKQECCEPWMAAKKLPPKRPWWDWKRARDFSLAKRLRKKSGKGER